MQSDDPPFLTVGTEVSAKFKGAFCEAKVKRMTKSVKCKIQLRTPPYGTIFADHTEIKGPLEVNQQVEITQGKATYKGIIQNIKDNSIYVVVFNDGDERQLRRTQVCIKGAKHFNEDVNLDSMPLYKPESFSHPVVVEDRRQTRKRRKLGRSKQRREQQQWTAIIKEEKEDDGRTQRSDDRSTPESNISSSTAAITTSSTTTITSNGSSSNTTNSTNNETMTVATPAVAGRTRRTRQPVSKLPMPRRLRSTRSGTFAQSSKQSDSDREMRNDDDNNNNNNDDGNGPVKSRMRRFTHPSKPSASRMIADKILTKSIARTRKKRYAAAAATDALKRIKELSGGDGKRRIGGIGGEDDDDDGGDEDDNDSDSEIRSDGDDDDDVGDDDDDGVGNGEGDADRGKGRTHARKKHCSSDEDDDKSLANEKMMDETNVTSSNRKSERKRQVIRDKVTEPAAKKLPEEADNNKKLYKVGSVIAMFDSSTRRGRWTPVVVVSEEAFKNATKGATSGEHNEPFLRSFRDGKYLTCSLDKLSSPGTVVLRYPEAVSKAALDRATAFAENDVLPMGWEKSQIYGEDARRKKNDRRSPSTDAKKRPETSERAKQEKEKTKASAVESSSVESESSTEEEYGEERDQFIAQLYKYHEERRTPINRAPILGGKDIDLFRLYNVVQGLGGKKRVTENNRWRSVLQRLHLEGCPGATPVTVKNAYSRYFDHFITFYRNLGMPNWLSTSTPSTSSRSERPTRLLDRHNIKLQRKRRELLKAKKKEKAQKERAAKGRTAKREKDENAAHTKREKAKKEERNVTKSDVSEDDDKGKAAPSVSSQSSTPLPYSSPGIKRKSKTKDEEEQEKGSVSDSGTIESSKEKGVVKDEKESSTKGRPRGSRKKEKDANRDEEQQQSGSKAADIDKRFKSFKANKPEPRSFGEGSSKRKSPSIASTASNVDQGISGSDDDARSRQIRLKEARKNATGRSSADHKEASISKREESVSGNNSDNSHAFKKEKNKEGIVPWANCCPATILTQFYMGQNIKAYHHGQWYDARVITLGVFSHQDVLSSMMDFEARCKAINESNECNEKERNEALTAATARLNDRLESILRERICCVHYLGWNSRYDEWVALIKIKVHEKDQKASVEQFLSVASDKLNAATLEAAVAWRSSVDPTRLLAAEGSSGMRIRKVEGRVRKRRRRKICYFDEYVQRIKKYKKKKKPRRLSHTHERSESRSRSTTISEKKIKKSKTPQISVANSSTPETSSNLIEPIPATVTAPAESDTDVVLRRLPDEATVSEAPPQLSFATEVVSSTISASCQAEDKSEEFSNLNGQQAVSEICSVVTCVSQDASKEQLSTVPEITDSGSDAQKTVEMIKTEETEQSAIPVAEPALEEVVTREMKEPEVDRESVAAEETGKDDENSNHTVTVSDETKVEEEEQHHDKSERQNLDELTILTRSIELESGEDIENREQQIAALPQIAPAESAVEKAISPCRESVSVESEAAAEDTTLIECDDEAWHPPMSLSLRQRGRGMTKKKIGKVASGTMSERKGPGKGPKRITNEEQSKESEESSSSDEESLPSVRDRWHALKVRMQQKIEVEGSMANAEEQLNLEPIDSSLTGEALINKLQERMQELRDIYHSIRSDQVRLDRRWRKTLERKRQRDREHRKKETSAESILL